MDSSSARPLPRLRGCTAWRRRRAGAGRAAAALAALWLAAIAAALPAAAAKDDDDDDDAKPARPNVYLDLSTQATTVPANSLAFGFGGGPWLARRQLSSPAAIGVGVSVPLTVDLNDRLSVYAGVFGSAQLPESAGAPWTSFEINSWMAGFTAELYQQNGGAFPTVTLQSTLSAPTVNWQFPTSSIDTNLEFDYALDADETRGLLAGVRYIYVMVDSGMATIDSPVIGYLGGYYQWPSNWKVSLRTGLQSFGGAQFGALTPIRPFTQPILRIDLDQLDDNDNRLFGVSGQIAWTPTPSYMLTLRTPLYALRN